MEMTLPISDPIQQLIQYYVDELFNEVVYNQDSSQFWKKASDHVFEVSLVSFRESVLELQKALIDDRAMYNYWTATCFRFFSQPFTQSALINFTNGFDAVAKDTMFGDAFNYRSTDLSNVEKLILFFSVHRDQIAMKFDEQTQVAAAKAANNRRRNK